MLFYFPIALTAICTLFQTHFCKNGYVLYAILLAVGFICAIILFFLDYPFLVYLVLGNFLFYLMAAASFFMRSSY